MSININKTRATLSDIVDALNYAQITIFERENENGKLIQENKAQAARIAALEMKDPGEMTRVNNLIAKYANEIDVYKEKVRDITKANVTAYEEIEKLMANIRDLKFAIKGRDVRINTLENVVIKGKVRFSTTYVRVRFPDYQPLMEKYSDQWAKDTVAIGDSDVLIPANWLI